ncbi:MAG: sensor histidine kinase [Pseudomonadota bacterium]
MSVLSLRKRLILIILLPLVLISLIAGFWRYSVAQNTAEALFDRSLIAVALAISRDVTVSDGDALSAVTRDLMRDAAEGEVYYHVHGPDGVYITGYATPPLPPADLRETSETPALFDAVYRGEAVRAVRLREETSLFGLSGFSTVTVWQTLENRRRLASDLGVQAAIVIGVLILTVAAVVYFGVERGLRPLTDLELAISQRSSSDLRPIKRALPVELSGVVRVLNDLFERVQRSITSKDIFISNAAHQLRNPVAGVLSMAQSLQTAPRGAELDQRITDLVDATRNASRLTTQLLSYERARAERDPKLHTSFDLIAATRRVVDRVAPKALKRSVDIGFESQIAQFDHLGDEVLYMEAVDNLIDNALLHGGPDLSAIQIAIRQTDKGLTISISDNGVGIPQKDWPKALSRFSQVGTGGGSGLGLPIAVNVARSLGGGLALSNAAPGLCVTLTVPVASTATSVSKAQPRETETL